MRDARRSVGYDVCTDADFGVLDVLWLKAVFLNQRLHRVHFGASDDNARVGFDGYNPIENLSGFAHPSDEIFRIIAAAKGFEE